MEQSMISSVLVVLGFLVAVKFMLKLAAFVWMHFLRPQSDLRKYGAEQGGWAVVTGCTDGIGLGFARKLSERGFNLILVSRNEGKLKDVAKQFTTKTKIVAVDCSDMSSGTFDSILSAVEGLDVGMVIHNVGVSSDYPIEFEKSHYDDIQRIIDVNVSFTTKLTYLFVPILQRRKRSCMIFLSSITGTQSMPLLTAYAASKAYDDIFARSLSEEFRVKGIDVASVIPGFVVSSMSKLRKPNFFVPMPDKYAHDTLGKLDSGVGCTSFCPYYPHHLQHILLNLLPSSIVASQVYKATKAIQLKAKKKIGKGNSSC